MAESLDSIHEQLTSISGALGRVEGTTKATATDVRRISTGLETVKEDLTGHIADDTSNFIKVFNRLAFWRGGIAVIVVVLGVVAGLFSGWLTQ